MKSLEAHRNINQDAVNNTILLVCILSGKIFENLIKVENEDIRTTINFIGGVERI